MVGEPIIHYCGPDFDVPPELAEAREKTQAAIAEMFRLKYQREDGRCLLAAMECEGPFCLLSEDYFTPGPSEARMFTAEAIASVRHWSGPRTRP